tara:strand:- start:868 stop:1047 length:180 start_codon:yes stop_codon:yes gene_type:complete
MKFYYQHDELYDYNFVSIGTELEEDGSVEMTDAQYKRFSAETINTTHRVTLKKEPTWNN